MNKLRPILVLFMTSCFILGQEWTITGKVTAAKDLGELTGVIVMEVMTNNGTNTDASGNYTIAVEENAIVLRPLK